jgi:hypothetical protein
MRRRPALTFERGSAGPSASDAAEGLSASAGVPRCLLQVRHE